MGKSQARRLTRSRYMPTRPPGVSVFHGAELLRRDAEGVEHDGHVAGGADKPVVEEGRDVLLENLLLLRAAGGGEEAGGVPFADAGDGVQEADEVAHLGVVVEILGEVLDARPEAAAGAASFPSPRKRGCSRRDARQEGEVVVPVQFVVGAAEEEEEILVAGQVFDGGQLELEDAEMAAVEIDGVDVLRLVDEIIEHVAAAGGDGEHPAFAASARAPSDRPAGPPKSGCRQSY